MQIFIGSSSEALPAAKLVATWIRSGTRHEALLWTNKKCFPAGKSTFESLLRLSGTADGAIFIFGEDDVLHTRGRVTWSTRDNVVLEYGLFLGSLGPDSVLSVYVGDPHVSSDLLGLQLLRIPSRPSPNAKGNRRKLEVKSTILKWAAELFPAYLRGLGFERARKEQKDWANPTGSRVRDILLGSGLELIEQNSSGKIKALCSNKGRYGNQYYAHQFRWLRAGKDRTLQRIFVRERLLRGSGFSRDEERAIRSHLELERHGAEIRWVYRDVLGAEYSSSLGFAVFGRGWLVHWETERGWSYSPKTDGDGLEIAERLTARFETLWAKARPFGRDVRG